MQVRLLVPILSAAVRGVQDDLSLCALLSRRRAGFWWRSKSEITDLRRMTRKRPDQLQLLEWELTGEIIGAFYAVYNELGFGFLESIYRRTLATECRLRGLRVIEEAPVEVVYKGVEVGRFRVDLVVADRVIVEVKSASQLGPTDKRQVTNYLRATSLEVGLLCHFGPEASFYRFADQNDFQRERPTLPASGEDPAVPVQSV
ncbi:MAG TPA: GxxExxY protein [Gemmatimonadaceae bacterium]|nr:GxxExxY protein [Gemmatimonadaceae bacterium]